MCSCGRLGKVRWPGSIGLVRSTSIWRSSRSWWSAPVGGCGRMWCTGGSPRWASPAVSAPPAGWWRRPRSGSVWVSGGCCGRGSPSRDCGREWDWGEGPRIKGRRTSLWCAWLAWSRFRVVIPVWDKTMPTIVSCLDTTLRRVGGVPTYALTDNEKTVSVDHVATIAVCNRRDRGGGPALRDDHPHGCPGRPANEGRFGGHRAHRQGRPRAHGREPARGVPHVRGAGGGLPGVLRGGQRPAAPRDPAAPGRGADRGTHAAPIRCPVRLSRSRSAPPGG